MKNHKVLTIFLIDDDNANLVNETLIRHVLPTTQIHTFSEVQKRQLERL